MFGLSLVRLVITAAPGLSAFNFKGYDWNTKAERKVFSACDLGLQLSGSGRAACYLVKMMRFCDPCVG
jgi:hypothetical protein